MTYRFSYMSLAALVLATAAGCRSRTDAGEVKDLGVEEDGFTRLLYAKGDQLCSARCDQAQFNAIKSEIVGGKLGHEAATQKLRDTCLPEASIAQAAMPGSAAFKNAVTSGKLFTATKTNVSYRALMAAMKGPACPGPDESDIVLVGDDDSVKPLKPVAFDVNDWSILFPTGRDGMPYPNISMDGATDANGNEMWPKKTAFQPMIDFAGGTNFGDQPIVSPVFTVAARPPEGAVQEGPVPQAAPNFKRRSIGTFIDDKGVEQFDARSVVHFNGTNVTDQKNWRIVSLRADPCAQQDAGVCNVEFRLIVQPLNQFGQPIDSSAHLLYNFGPLQLSGKESEIAPGGRPASLPQNISFKGLIEDLAKLKELAAGLQGGATNGVPLGAHPALLAEVKTTPLGQTGPIAKAVIDLIKKYTAGGLTTVTTMQLTTPPEPWVFFVGEVSKGVWRPVAITGGTKALSIRFALFEGTMSPAPTNESGISNAELIQAGPKPIPPQNPGPIPVPPTSPGPSPVVPTIPVTAREGVVAEPTTTAEQRDREAQTVATKPISTPILANSFIIDNPGRFGGPGKRSSVNNTDCISCHMGSTSLARIPEMSATVHGTPVNPATGKPNMYVPADGVTAYAGVGANAANASAAGFWNFHNFSFADVGRDPSLEARMINEAGETVRFINEDVLGVPNPGFVCVAGVSEARRLANHAALWDCNVKQRKPFAECVKSVCSVAGI